MKKTNATNEVKKRSTLERFLLLAPLMFVIVIVPLVVRYKGYDPKLEQYEFFEYANWALDWFLYWKQWLFVGACGVMICIIIARAIINKKTIRFSKIFIPLIIYGLLAILSTVFSEYPQFGMTGIYEQFENLWALLGYTLVPYYAYLMIETEEDVVICLFAAAIGATILSFIGLTQAVGHDFWFSSEIGKRIVYPKEGIGSWNFSGTALGENRAYMSQYNPNYVGIYVGLIAPIIILLLFFSKNIYKSILYALILLALLVTMFSSQSKTGFIGIAISLILILFFVRKTLLKRWYVAIPIALIIVLSFFIIDKINNQKYFDLVRDRIKEGLALNVVEPSLLTDIDTEDLYVVVTYDNNELYIMFDVYTDSIVFGFWDQNEVSLGHMFNEETKQVDILDERFEAIKVAPAQVGDYYGFVMFLEGKTWYFTNQTGDNTFYYRNDNGRLCKIDTHTPGLFKGYERFISGRGYLWSHTIPLLKDNIFLGTGADTFILAFPQYDYVNLKNYGWTEMITKPHSLYLQVGVQTGVLSLIALVAFYFIYFIWSIKLYTKQKFDKFLPQAGIAVFIGSVSYMIVGITNDSTITVAPLFWALIGVGIAINNLIAKEQKAV